jgi:hypothetical protein
MIDARFDTYTQIMYFDGQLEIIKIVTGKLTGQENVFWELNITRVCEPRNVSSGNQRQVAPSHRF